MVDLFKKMKKQEAAAATPIFVVPAKPTEIMINISPKYHALFLHANHTPTDALVAICQQTNTQITFLKTMNTAAATSIKLVQIRGMMEHVIKAQEVMHRMIKEYKEQNVITLVVPLKRELHNMIMGPNGNKVNW